MLDDLRRNAMSASELGCYLGIAGGLTIQLTCQPVLPISQT